MSGIARTSRRPAHAWSPVRAPGQWYGALLVALLLVSKVDVRDRDPQLALQGSVDMQIAVELAAYALVACWILGRLLQDRVWLMSAFPRNLGPALQVYLLIGGLAALTAVLRSSSLSVVRAGQLLILLGLAVLVQRDVAARRTSVVVVYITAVRVLAGAVVLLILAGLLVPEWTSVRTTHGGFDRYRLLQMHPIISAQLIGLALVACATQLLVELRPVSRFEQALLALTTSGFAAALWATRSRGALLATGIAILLLVLLTPRRRRRALALLGGMLAAAPLVAGVFDSAFRGTLLRGQTAEQLSSLTGRTELFSYAAELIAERPVLGHGYLAARSLFLDRFPWAGESHNALIDIGISLGLTGLVLYAALFVAAVAPLMRGLRVQAGARREQAAIGCALLSWLLVDGLTADSYGGPVSPGLLALLLVVLLGDDLRRSRRAAYKRDQSALVRP